MGMNSWRVMIGVNDPVRLAETAPCSVARIILSTALPAGRRCRGLIAD